MTFWLATTNSHKIFEIKSFFKKNNCNFYDVSCLKNYTSPKENGSTFRENARIKAEALAAFLIKSKVKASSDCFIIGEDSGLKVFSLSGAPGIYSARYSGLKGTDRENNQLLLKNMTGHKDRKARYVCAICCVLENQKYFFEGELKGCISLREKGSNGFGYDPLFVPEGEKNTLGQLPFAFKERISHRTKALSQMKKHFVL